MIIDIIASMPANIMDAARWWWLDPSAGWLRVVVLSAILLPITDKIVRRLGWDKNEDHDKTYDDNVED